MLPSPRVGGALSGALVRSIAEAGVGVKRKSVAGSRRGRSTETPNDPILHESNRSPMIVRLPQRRGHLRLTDAHRCWTFSEYPPFQSERRSLRSVRTHLEAAGLTNAEADKGFIEL
jgi:hypothetical protein